jgi:uncharacterized membrane protein YesL
LYWRSVSLALPLAVLLALILFTADTINRFPDRTEMVLALAAQMGLGLVAAILHIYLLPVLALYELSPAQTVHAALALIGKYIGQTLALAVLGIALLAASTLHPLVGVVVPMIWSVVVMNAVWRLTRHTPLNQPER